MISEKMAKLFGYSISTTLSSPQKYQYRNANPILRCLVDQCNADPSWNGKFTTENELGDEIIKAIDEEKIDWRDMYLISKDQWLENMKTDIGFYRNYSENANQMEVFECHLLEMAANFLKRKIKLYSFNSSSAHQDPRTFNPKGKEVFCLLGCTSILHQNFFISLQK